jgi:putative ABC transport system ATP-binding protein
VGKPRLLLSDEPTGNLDSQMGDEIISILQDLNRTEKTTLVMVTHDPRQAEKTARTIRMFDGRRVH